MAHCSFPGCFGKLEGRGYCGKHYQRLVKHGDPAIARPKAPDGAAEAFARVAAECTSDDCLLWPYGKDRKGYGRMRWGSAMAQSHWVVCTLAHGERPTPTHEAAHSCGNPQCVNARHLRWATVKENLSDRWRHGTMPIGERNWKAVLTEAKVREIKSRLSQGERQVDIARSMGLKRAAVNHIAKRRTWAWLQG